jgi:hypothetical protein
MMQPALTLGWQRKKGVLFAAVRPSDRIDPLDHAQEKDMDNQYISM